VFPNESHARPVEGYPGDRFGIVLGEGCPRDRFGEERVQQDLRLAEETDRNAVGILAQVRAELI